MPETLSGPRSVPRATNRIRQPHRPANIWSDPMPSRDLFSGRVKFGIKRRVVLPAALDGAQPGACQDADGMGMSASPVDCPLVDPRRPGATRRLPLAKSVTAARSFLFQNHRNTVCSRLPDWRVDGEAPASPAKASSVGKCSRQSPISASRVAARTIPDRGRLASNHASQTWSGGN